MDDRTFRDYERRPRCRCMPMPSTSPAAPLSSRTRAGSLAAQLERLHGALQRKDA